MPAASAGEAHTLLQTALLYLKPDILYLNFSVLVNNAEVPQRMWMLAPLEKPPLAQARHRMSLSYINQAGAQQALLLLLAACWGWLLGWRVLGGFGPQWQPSRQDKCNGNRSGIKKALCWSSVSNILGKSSSLERCCG